MDWGKTGRRWVLPTALSVTSVAVAWGCSGNESKSEELVQCSSVPSTPNGKCQKCKGADGGLDCAGNPDCHYDQQDGICFDGVA